MAIPVNPFTFANDLATFLATAYGNATYDEVLSDEKSGSATINSSSLTPSAATTQWANLVDSFIIAVYPMMRGTARSMWCRAANTAGALALLSGGGTSSIPQVLSDDGTSLAFRGLNTLGAVVVLDRAVSNLQVSSTTHTAIYSYAIPANMVAAGRTLRLTWNGHFFNNDGANRSMSFRLVLGGVTIWEEITATQTVSATRRPLKITIDISVQSQTLHIANVEISFCTAAAATVGVGDLAANYQISGGGESIDSTANLANAQTLELQVAIGPSITNVANVYVRRRGAYLELI